jgi:hypothetical protein
MRLPQNNNDYIDGGIIGISGIDDENNNKNHVAQTESNDNSNFTATDDYTASNNDKNENNKHIVVSVDVASEDYNSNSNNDNIIMASSSTVEAESAKKRTMMKKKKKFSSNDNKITEKVNPASVKQKEEEEGGGCNNKDVAVLVLPPNNENAINGSININNGSSNTIVSRTNNKDDKNIHFSNNISEEEQDDDGGSNKNVAELPVLPNNQDDFVTVKNDGSSSTISNKPYPADTYSFLSLYGPIKNPGYFSYGLMVYLFQMTFLVLMVLSKTHHKWSNNGDEDNPDAGILSIVQSIARFIPANVSPIVRATQITATLAYFVFADSTMLDIVTAVELFPRFKQVTSDDKVECMIFSSILRLSQGVLAVIVSLILIVTTSTTIDIILNFTAINFISTLDDVGFEIIKWGKYGPKFEEEAKRIETLPLPRCIYRKYKHVRYLCAVIPLGMMFLSMIGCIIILQENDNIWVTKIFRVQFQDKEQGLQVYNGCYEKNEAAIGRIEGFRRKLFEGYEYNAEIAKFGYCMDDRRWILFKGDITNACDAGEDNNELARSSKTNTFDVSTMFGEPWYSSSNTPLDVYFVEDTDDTELNEATCSSFLNDGNCDLVFNTFDYQYDGGDCCAATCSESNCGIGSLKNAFGSNNNNISGDGFPNCRDPDLVPITIRLDNIVSSFEPQYWDNNVIFKNGFDENSTIDENLANQDLDDDYIREVFRREPVKPLLFIDCDGSNVLNVYVDKSMEKQTETIMVNDDADCSMTIRNATRSKDPIWYVNYTIFHGDKKSVKSNPIVILQDFSNERTSAYFKKIPNCYFDKLSDHIIDNSTVYMGIDYDPTAKAIAWLTNDGPEDPICEDSFFLERYALSVISFSSSSDNSEDMWINKTRQCVWSSIICDNGAVVKLNLGK